MSDAPDAPDASPRGPRSAPPDARLRAHAVLLHVAYDGRLFHGAVRQHGLRTVAGELDGAIADMDPRALPLRMASRTDAGVHARSQVAIFHTDKDIAPRGWVLGINQQLPDEISVLRAARIAPGTDPSTLATRKTYRYLILQSELRDPFWAGRAWRVPERLNHALLQAEASQLLGEHDFAAFRGARDERTDTVRRLLRAEVRSLPDEPRGLCIEVEGNRFLYKMMRIIAGTLVDVARGRLEPGAVSRGLTSCDRNALGMTAPPGGLYLQHLELSDSGADAWPRSD